MYVIFLTILLNLVTPQQQDPCSEKVVSYEKDVAPFVISTCALSQCHDSQVNPSQGRFDDFLSFRSKALSGKIIEKIEHKKMPPLNTIGPKEVSPQQIEDIKCWIASGAPQN